MKPLNLIPADIDLAFIPKRKLFFVFSFILMIASIGMVFTKGLNFGIDFKGGILIEVRTPEAADIGKMRGQITVLGFRLCSIYSILLTKFLLYLCRYHLT